MTTLISARTRPSFQKHASDEGSSWTSTATVAQLQEMLKAASLGGEQEQGFEQAFSSLAYAYLKDRAPRLIDFIIGFQLVDRNEDNTKAVGVFGFKVGKQWLYAPVFFLNGDLKGHELMYLKNADQFLPLKENWVNYVLSRKPHILGEGSQKDVFQLGALAPNIERLSWPPAQSKHGGDALALAKLAAELGQVGAGSAGGLSAGPSGGLSGGTGGGGLDLGTGSAGAPANTSASPAPAASAPAAPAPLSFPEAPAPAAPQAQPSPGASLHNTSEQLATPNATALPPMHDSSAFEQGLQANGLSLDQLRASGMDPDQEIVKAQSDPMYFQNMRHNLQMAGGNMTRQASDRSETGFGNIAAWARPFAALWASCATKQARFLNPQAPAGSRLDLAKVAADPMAAALAGLDFDLREFLSTDWRLAKAAWDIGQQYPLIKQGFDKFYGPSFFLEVATACKEAQDKACCNLMPKAPAKKKPAAPKAASDSLIPETVKTAASLKNKVKIVVNEDVALKQNMPGAPKLTTTDRTKLLHHGYLVKDERTGDELSLAYNTQVKQVLTNPPETGIYDVLESPGEFDRMLVVLHPYANSGQRGFTTVVRLEGDNKAWLNAANSSIFTKRVKATEQFRDWFKGLKGPKTLDKDAYYLAVSESGSATCPFRVREVFEDGRYKVDFQSDIDYGRGRRSSNMPRTVLDAGPQGCGIGESCVSNYDALLVVAGRKGTKLRAASGELHVPDDFKFFKLKGPPAPKKDDLGLAQYDPCTGNSSDAAKPIVPGDIADIQVLFTEKTAALKIYGDHNEATLSSEKRGLERGSWKSALFSLIENHGLGEDQAQAMLKAAQAKGAASYRIKYADNYPFPGPGSGAPTIPAPEYGTEPIGYNNVRSQYPQEQDIPVPGLEASRTDPRIYDPFLRITPDQGAMNTAQQAAGDGQKEVFDTSMLGGLLKATSQDSLVNRYLGKFMAAIDGLGRTLFSLYWHGEEFQDRYGKATMPELEDALRNAFENLADVTLTLKEKSVETDLRSISAPDVEEAARN